MEIEHIDPQEKSLIKLLEINIHTNEQKFRKYDYEIKLQYEKLKDIEDLVLSHSRQSNSNAQTLLFLVCGLFLCLLLVALLGTTIEGHIGTSKINYSSNGILQVFLVLLTGGGGGVALNQIQKTIRK